METEKITHCMPFWYLHTPVIGKLATNGTHSSLIIYFIAPIDCCIVVRDK